MDIIDIVVFGLISIFVIGVVVIIGFFIVGDNVYPIMGQIANQTTSGNAIDVQEGLDFGIDMFYIALFLLFAIPFLLIIVKYFYEREPTTGGYY